MIIEDRLVSEGGWIERRGVIVASTSIARRDLVPGDAKHADRWVDHVRLIYPDDAEHIIAGSPIACSDRDEKINHALVLGGAQGIGKDTLLEPVSTPSGRGISTRRRRSRCSGGSTASSRAVILRISEARDLGEFDRFKFYDHMKVYTAAPPDVLRVDEKHLREYNVLNVLRRHHHDQPQDRRHLSAGR